MYGLLGQRVRTRSRGWQLCHGVDGVSDIPQRNLRHLSKHLSAMKAAGSSLLWGTAKKENNLRHLLFPKRLGA